MGQADVIAALESVDEGLSDAELANAVNGSIISIRQSLNRLFKTNEVERIKLTKEQIEELNKSFSGRHYIWKIK